MQQFQFSWRTGQGSFLHEWRRNPESAGRSGRTGRPSGESPSGTEVLPASENETIGYSSREVPRYATNGSLIEATSPVSEGGNNSTMRHFCRLGGPNLDEQRPFWGSLQHLWTPAVRNRRLFHLSNIRNGPIHWEQRTLLALGRGLSSPGCRYHVGNFNVGSYYNWKLLKHQTNMICVLTLVNL